MRAEVRGMTQYRVKLGKKAGPTDVNVRRVSMVLATLTEEFNKAPRRAVLERAVKAFEGTDPMWSTPLVVAGRYIAAYEARYGFEWRGPLAVLVGQARHLIERMGAALAHHAEAAVFGERMKWVKQDQVRFLMREDNVTRFVIPAVQQANEKTGEQAEWGETARDASGGCEEVEL